MKKDGLPSYVYKQYKKYVVQQQTNKERVVYGRFPNKTEALKLRDKLVREGIITRRNTCQHLIKNYDDRYIVRTPSKKFAIQKKVDGCMQSFGTFSSLEDARAERDYMESRDWNYDEID